MFLHRVTNNSKSYAQVIDNKMMPRYYMEPEILRVLRSYSTWNQSETKLHIY
jgi:hypothetical protein